MQTWRGLTLLLPGLLLAAPVWAQLRLPPTDGRGEVLAPPESVVLALQHQQTIIYLLLGLLLASLAANVWIGVVVVRLQFTVERVAEAIRRVDVLENAFRVAQKRWDDGVEASTGMQSPPQVSAIHDLDTEIPTRWRKGITRHD